MNVIISKKYNWSQSQGHPKYWYIGSEKPVRDFVAFCQNRPNATIEELGNELSHLVGNFAVIVQVGRRIIAAVDKIRSYPVFYVSDGKGPGVSNSARVLRDEFGLSDIDDLSLLEFKMAGFVTGRETLYTNLYQLQAGEFLISDENVRDLTTHRYYLFYSKETRSESEDELIDELDEVTNRIFSRIVQETDGRPIWVPLSGGLDSRLVLCKLKQLGYDNLHAFSYGPPHNHEAKWARYVAKRVGVPWLFVPYESGDIRKFFFSQIRKDYWTFSGEFSSLPFMVDEYAMYYLKRKKLIPDGAIVINGQSGDFISGGHTYGYHSSIAPGDGRKYGEEAIVSAIVKKHYSLNTGLMTKRNLERISEKILSLLGIDHMGEMDGEEVSKYYEWWEWQERQSKYVVNGQRSYDYFGHRWYLPLWADEYLEFWPQTPFRYRFKQYLHKAYLERTDLFGLFKNFKPVVWNWQGPSLLVIPAAWALKLLFGPQVAGRFYHYMSYFGKYHNHYAPFGIAKWFANAKHLKAPFVFYIDTLLGENKIEVKSKGDSACRGSEKS